MPIDNVFDVAPRAQYTAIAAQTAFTVPFSFFVDSDLVVYDNDTLMALSTDYTVSGAGDDNGGTVTFAVGRTAGHVITIYRDLPIERTTDFQQNGPNLSASMNDELDRITLVQQQLSSDICRAIRFPKTATQTNAQSELSPISNWFNRFLYIGSTGLLEAAATISGVVALTQSLIGQLLNPKTDAENSAGVTPTNYQYEPGWFDRYGTNAVPGTTDMSAAINAALSCNQPCFGSGTYAANNLTQSHNFQRVTGIGKTHIVKNANGDLLTSTGDDVVFTNIDGRDDAQAYTGHGLVASGDRCIFDSCGGYLIAGRALLATGQAVQVRGTCNIWRSRDVSGTGYDIEIGVSGTATLYHRLHGIYTGIATSGIKFVDCGGHSIVGGQFGKLHDAIGTGPAGVGGVLVTAARINGDVTLDNSGAQFSAAKFSSITLTLSAGTSGHRIDDSCVFQTSPAATIVDNSTNSYVVDSRVSGNITYTPTWTGSVSNPAIGDGTLTGRYNIVGKQCFVTIQLVCGSTTTYGSGSWYFSLPRAPSAFGPQFGAARVLDSGTNFRTGVAVTVADGTTRLQATIDSDTANVGTLVPITWANGDQLYLTISYLTD